MIQFSENAAKEVTRLKQENAQENQWLRVFVEPGGCSGFEYGMSFDEKRDGDQLLESNGVQFLVDEASLVYLQGCSIDFDDGLHGKGFEINNPNAHNTCGCGKSFN
jgi:iron-sulfur cluster assembly accessory protein